MDESDLPKKRGVAPVGNFSIKLANGHYLQVGAVWFTKGRTGSYFAMRCKQDFSMKEGEQATLFINKGKYRPALVARDAFIL